MPNETSGWQLTTLARPAKAQADGLGQTLPTPPPSLSRPAIAGSFSDDGGFPADRSAPLAS
jgi:hypothetical protein